jgi:drug/metabolite transporter (DMT)-like permease
MCICIPIVYNCYQNMEQQHTTTAKVVCIISLCAGIIAAVFSFLTRQPATAILLGAAAAVIGIVALLLGRKNIDDMQMATAGLFMAIVSCIVGLWQIYS